MNTFPEARGSGVLFNFGKLCLTSGPEIRPSVIQLEAQANLFSLFFLFLFFFVPPLLLFFSSAVYYVFRDRS